MPPDVPSENKKVSTTVYITARQRQLLQVLHRRTKVPVAEYIRQGIDLILEQNRHLLPGQLTLDEVASETSDRRDAEGGE